jgi:hypothetical protein
MEKIIDFEEFIKQMENVAPTAWAIYDERSGIITEVVSTFIEPANKNKLEVDSDIAELLSTGKKQTVAYRVDITTTPPTLVDNNEFDEKRTLTKIDDVVHRVIEKQWSKEKNPEIKITYTRSKKTLSVELSKKFNFTNKKRVHWTGETEMILLLTAYNDPNYILEMLSLRVGDVIGEKKIFKNIEMPEQFSVFTRRIFNNYVLEIK